MLYFFEIPENFLILQSYCEKYLTLNYFNNSSVTVVICTLRPQGSCSLTCGSLQVGCGS